MDDDDYKTESEVEADSDHDDGEGDTDHEYGGWMTHVSTFLSFLHTPFKTSHMLLYCGIHDLPMYRCTDVPQVYI